LHIVLSARSARGLSLPAYVLETLAYAITSAYSYRNKFPFSTYGENLFLTLQNTLITLLIIYYPPPSLRHSQNTVSRLTAATFTTIATGVALYSLPKDSLAFLQFATLPLSLFSKVPQIRQNARAGSTGQLSAFAVISQIAGCLARLFTTATEVGDNIVAAGFALALVLNIVVGVQMWMYWGKDEKEDVNLGKTKLTSVSEKERQFNVVVPPQSPLPRSSTPTGRKWARKVD
jgi:mannose-P-dolichol utilization defect protein 1